MSKKYIKPTIKEIQIDNTFMSNFSGWNVDGEHQGNVEGGGNTSSQKPGSGDSDGELGWGEND